MGDSIKSARSNGKGGSSCETVVMRGTSMATPVAAGAALLVRQYFMDIEQKFWTANCRSDYASICKGIVPSGVFVKAAIIHSGANSMAVNSNDDYYSNEDISLGSVPDNFQGYGRIFLQNVLPLKGLAEFDLFFDDLRVLQEDSEIIYTVEIQKSDRPLKVSLVWYDPPGIDGLSTPVLLHDLNLKVAPPCNCSDVYFGNGGDIDHLNNNEQVFVATPVVGNWTVSVSSKALPFSGYQKFTILITSAGRVVSPH